MASGRCWEEVGHAGGPQFLCEAGCFWQEQLGRLAVVGGMHAGRCGLVDKSIAVIWKPISWE